jgi:hypothetical protein
VQSVYFSRPRVWNTPKQCSTVSEYELLHKKPWVLEPSTTLTLSAFVWRQLLLHGCIVCSRAPCCNFGCSAAVTGCTRIKPRLSWRHETEPFLRNCYYTQLVKKFPTFYGARRFNTECKITSQRSLPRARWVQSIPSKPIFQSFILILSSHRCLGLPNNLFTLGFPTKILHFTPSLYFIIPLRATCPAHFLLFYLIVTIILKEDKLRGSPLCSFLQPPTTSPVLSQNILLCTPLSYTLKLFLPLK